MQTKVTNKNGVYAFDIDGELVFPAASRSFRPCAKVIHDFADYGFSLFNIFPTGVMTALKDRTIPYSEFGEVWLGEGEYSRENLKKQVDLFAENAPDGKILLMLQTDTRDWFLKEHPECMDSWSYLNETVGCKAWQKSAERFMCDLIDIVNEMMPERLYGVVIMAGGTTEWYIRERPKKLPSEAQREAFERWSGGREFPELSEIYAETDGAFLDPVKNPRAVEYRRFCNEEISSTLCRFASVVKKHTNGNIAVGAFFGYLSGIGFLNAADSGYLGLPEVLASGDIDFLICPSSYSLRKKEDTGGFRVPIDSFSFNGKLYYLEIDGMTHLVKNNPLAVEHGNKFDGVYKDFDEVKAVFRRDVGMTLAKGQGYWWFDMFSGYYDSPEVMEELKKLRLLSERVLRHGRKSVSEVAVVVDPESLYYLAYGSSYPPGRCHSRFLNRMGTPWDSYIYDDLEKPDFPTSRYKLYIFQTQFKYRDGCAALFDRLRAEGASLVFIHAPGYVTDSGFSLDTMEKYCGIHLVNARAEREKILTDGMGEIEYVLENVFDGTMNCNPKPLFCVSDSDAEVLGRYAETGEAAFAIKRRSIGFDCYCGCGDLNVPVLRYLAREAGCHIYLDTDEVLSMSDSLVCIYANVGEGGDRIFKVKDGRSVTLTDFFTGEVFTGSESIAIPLAKNECRIFTVS